MGNPTDFGKVKPGTTLYIPFPSYDSNDPTASSTITGLAVTDIEIYKNGSTTQRSSDAGYTLLDTDGIDFDGITGINGFSVNLADNTDSGFYVNGGQYWVVLSSITVDSGTINGIPATFRIGYDGSLLDTTIATLSSQTSFTLTDGPAEDDALNGMWCIIHDVASAVQCGIAVISDYTGSSKTVTLVVGTTFTAAAGDNISIMGPAPALSTVCTETRLSELDAGTAGKMANQVDETRTDTEDLQTQIGIAGAGLTAINLPDQTMNITGNITGNLSGSVGSVTGAVGSVTGNVGGSVASVTAGVTLANGPHGGAAATITAKSVTVSNSDAGGIAVDISGTGSGNSHAIRLASTNAKAIAAASTNSDAISIDAPAGNGLVIIGGTNDILSDITGTVSLTGDLTPTMKASVNTEVDNALNTAIPASPTGDSMNDYIMRMKYQIINKQAITEANGNSITYKDDDTTAFATVAAAYTSDSTTTIRKRLE